MQRSVLTRILISLIDGDSANYTARRTPSHSTMSTCERLTQLFFIDQQGDGAVLDATPKADSLGTTTSSVSGRTESSSRQFSSQLFFMDRRGDSALLHTPLTPERLPNTQGTTPTSTSSAEDFISLTPTQKERRRKQRHGQSSKRKKCRNDGGINRLLVEQDVEDREEDKDGLSSDETPEQDVDPEEMAIMMDYIQNSSVGDLSSALTHLTSLSASSDEEEAEVGLYEALMMGHDDEEVDTSDDSSDEIPSFARLGLGSENDDSDDDEEYLKQDFEGRKSAWDENTSRNKDPSERKFQQILKADFGSKSQARKQKRREQAEFTRNKHQKARERANAGQNLNAALSRSGTKITKDVTTFLSTVNSTMHTFTQNEPSKPCVTLPPMPGAVRRLVYSMAREYHLLPKTRGKGKAKVSVLIRTQRSHVPQHWKSVVKQVVEAEGGRLKGNTRSPGSGTKKKKPPGAPDQKARPKLGSVVGEGSKPIGEGNIGHRMLKAMGWTEGQALGSEGSQGLVHPVEVMVRSKRSGLGNAI
ncbi:uncharacterized protein SPPG_03746 [Spizellomyces punctatus DAOM BR117]|uniref:Protein SQS1 n=1 Tax=Spizellomyces punctatus (strain DAOM BR117) TaxID=645134 RepID=A0A0L0HHR3_SPIPD|nr:uncharacterized protein SPPG_03746 [Spizellomyces punctatus DAOM BR117]KND00618.1 hypothetical protein SPPG_03746 [Spizellomyces punctatus DAOM BR117]|eukprot:XP_016608657.1 hypothetical protein SPPG_03746 [Spizellomyces punctatus DAOM BR117]